MDRGRRKHPSSKSLPVQQDIKIRSIQSHLKYSSKSESNHPLPIRRISTTSDFYLTRVQQDLPGIASQLLEVSSCSSSPSRLDEQTFLKPFKIRRGFASNMSSLSRNKGQHTLSIEKTAIAKNDCGRFTGSVQTQERLGEIQEMRRMYMRGKEVPATQSQQRIPDMPAQEGGGKEEDQNLSMRDLLEWLETADLDSIDF